MQNKLGNEAIAVRLGNINKETEYGWETIYDKISFPQGRKWQDYVNDTRLEMACGEGPYLVSRFDVTSGTKIPVKDRVGILDRKFRIISENTPDERSDYNIEKFRNPDVKEVNCFEY